MPRPNSKRATFKDLQLPRRKAIRFLERVQRGRLKAAQNHGCEIVARMELTELDAPPNYSIERPNGERFEAFDGVHHKPLAGGRPLGRSRRWSEATMSFEAVSDLAMSLALEEFEDLRRSSRPGR